MKIRKGLIYIIRNSINDKVYIGQTTLSLEDRWKVHLKPSVSKQRGSYKIYNAMNKYGKENFYCEILEDNIPIEELNNREINYIEKFDSFKNGYNSTKGGDGKFINKDYDIENILSKYKSGISATQISKEYGVSHITIERILHANNIEMRQNNEKIFDYMLDEIIKFASSHTYKETAALYNVNEKTIRRFLSKHGFRKYKKKVS